MAKAKAKVVIETIEVETLKTGVMKVWIKGTTPLIFNRLAAKAMHELLFPRGKKTDADKKQTLKHDVMAEYRNSMDTRSGKGPTRVLVPAPAIKGAMATAALETKGTNKTQIGRLVTVEGYTVDVYGVPQLSMMPVRSADQNKTPDIRTRAVIPEWCIPVTINFVRPQLNEKTVMQLLSNAGIIVGIGDFRPEKGKGNFGQFEVSTEAQCRSIVKSGGLKEQTAAIKNPECFDSASEELLAWFQSEVENRGKEELLAK